VCTRRAGGSTRIQDLTDTVGIRTSKPSGLSLASPLYVLISIGQAMSTFGNSYPQLQKSYDYAKIHITGGTYQPSFRKEKNQHRIH
jgi:hypothetical protein